MMAAGGGDRPGAELFDTHIGSWIEPGWAHFLGGDHAAVRASFERALAIDPAFSETVGGALARTLLLDQSGDQEKAAKIRTLALSTPIGPEGRTIAQALVGMGHRD